MSQPVDLSLLSHALSTDSMVNCQETIIDPKKSSSITKLIDIVGKKALEQADFFPQLQKLNQSIDSYSQQHPELKKECHVWKIHTLMLAALKLKSADNNPEPHAEAFFQSQLRSTPLTEEEQFDFILGIFKTHPDIDVVLNNIFSQKPLTSYSKQALIDLAKLAFNENRGSPEAKKILLFLASFEKNKKSLLTDLKNNFSHDAKLLLPFIKEGLSFQFFNLNDISDCQIISISDQLLLVGPYAFSALLKQLIDKEPNKTLLEEQLYLYCIKLALVPPGQFSSQSQDKVREVIQAYSFSEEHLVDLCRQLPNYFVTELLQKSQADPQKLFVELSKITDLVSFASIKPVTDLLPHDLKFEFLKKIAGLGWIEAPDDFIPVLDDLGLSPQEVYTLLKIALQANNDQVLDSPLLQTLSSEQKQELALLLAKSSYPDIEQIFLKLNITSSKDRLDFLKVRAQDRDLRVFKPLSSLPLSDEEKKSFGRQFFNHVLTSIGSLPPQSTLPFQEILKSVGFDTYDDIHVAMQALCSKEAFLNLGPIHSLEGLNTDEKIKLFQSLLCLCKQGMESSTLPATDVRRYFYNALKEAQGTPLFNPFCHILADKLPVFLSDDDYGLDHALNNMKSRDEKIQLLQLALITDPAETQLFIEDQIKKLSAKKASEETKSLSSDKQTSLEPSDKSEKAESSDFLDLSDYHKLSGLINILLTDSLSLQHFHEDLESLTPDEFNSTYSSEAFLIFSENAKLIKKAYPDLAKWIPDFDTAYDFFKLDSKKIHPCFMSVFFCSLLPADQVQNLIPTLEALNRWRNVQLATAVEYQFAKSLVKSPKASLETVVKLSHEKLPIINASVALTNLIQAGMEELAHDIFSIEESVEKKLDEAKGPAKDDSIKSENLFSSFTSCIDSLEKSLGNQKILFKDKANSIENMFCALIQRLISEPPALRKCEQVSYLEKLQIVNLLLSQKVSVPQLQNQLRIASALPSHYLKAFLVKAQNSATTPDLSALLHEELKKYIQSNNLFNLHGLENLDERYQSTLGSLREANAWATYERGLRSLNDPKALETYKLMIRKVFEGYDRLKAFRYGPSSPHTKKLLQDHPVVWEKWQTFMPNQALPADMDKEQNLNLNLHIKISDDFQDLFLCGTEVIGSCQRVDANAYLNKCLMGYVVDGKNQIVTIYNATTQKMVARSILRLLIDKETGEPALFLEKPYGEFTASQKKSLEGLAIEKAKELGCALFTGDYKSTESSKTLSSLGSPAAYEYSDASLEHVAIEGKFEIFDMSPLYYP